MSQRQTAKSNRPLMATGPRRLFAGRIVPLLAAISLLPLTAEEQVKSFEVNGFRELLNPSEFGPFQRVFAARVRDYTAQGAPTPDYLVLEHGDLIHGVDPAEPDGEERTFFFTFFKGFSYGVQQPSEIGALVFDIPELPSGLGDGPVSGFVRRTGSVAAAPGSSLNGFYEGATGEIAYSGIRASRPAKITLDTADAGQLSGETLITIFSPDEVELRRWRSDIYSFDDPSFRSTLLRRVDQLYYGALDRFDNPEALNWFDRRGILALVDTEDADGDGIPDFSDTRVSPAPFFASMELGNHWYYAPWMRAAVLATSDSWYLTTAHQWLYAPDAQQQGIWFYSPSNDLGWFWTREDLYPYLYLHADQTFKYYHWQDRDGNRMVGDGEAFLYDFEEEAWCPVRF